MTDNNKVSVITSREIINDSTTIPTTKAVHDYVNEKNYLQNLFPNTSEEDKKYFIIYDAWQNPVSMSKAFQ